MKFKRKIKLATDLPYRERYIIEKIAMVVILFVLFWLLLQDADMPLPAEFFTR